MTKLITFLFLFLGLLTNVQANQEIKGKALNESEVLRIETGLLKDSIKYKNWDDVAGVGISFFATAVSGEFDGDSQLLRNRAIEIINLSLDEGSLIGGNFLMITMLPIDINYSHSIAKKIILKHQKKISFDLKKEFNGIIITLVTTTLDIYKENKEELNFALESLELIEDSPQTYFFKAFLYKYLGVEELAENYLNIACNEAKDTKIVEACEEFLD